MPRNYEKEMADGMIAFRAKCSELNLVNAEGHELGKQRKAMDQKWEIYKEEATVINNQIVECNQRLVEIRSELQAMQATMLDLVIEFMLRGGS